MRQSDEMGGANVNIIESYTIKSTQKKRKHSTKRKEEEKTSG